MVQPNLQPVIPSQGEDLDKHSNATADMLLVSGSTRSTQERLSSHRGGEASRAVVKFSLAAAEAAWADRNSGYVRETHAANGSSVLVPEASSKGHRDSNVVVAGTKSGIAVHGSFKVAREVNSFGGIPASNSCKALRVAGRDTSYVVSASNPVEKALAPPLISPRFAMRASSSVRAQRRANPSGCSIAPSCAPESVVLTRNISDSKRPEPDVSNSFNADLNNDDTRPSAKSPESGRLDLVNLDQASPSGPVSQQELWEWSQLDWKPQ